MAIALKVVLFIFLLATIPFTWPILLVWMIIEAYQLIYFHSNRFKSLQQKIAKYIKDSNDLNDHIEHLRKSYARFEKTDYGTATYTNTSRYKYKKKGLVDSLPNANIYDCSRTVCDSARKQPFKYICKYFNVKSDEETVEELEQVLNNFAAAEDGKDLLVNQKNEIIDSISNDVPALIRKFYRKKLEKKLGFKAFNYKEIYFPTYVFRYTSAGGNSGNQYMITMDIEMLQRFINYLAEKVKFKKSAEGQRRLMTPALRRQIINRDDHTCQICGNSTYKEPNLLLEVDHIVPIAKGGITTESNLQTLCWKCNRSKGAKLA